MATERKKLEKPNGDLQFRLQDKCPECGESRIESYTHCHPEHFVIWCSGCHSYWSSNQQERAVWRLERDQDPASAARKIIRASVKSDTGDWPSCDCGRPAGVAAIFLREETDDRGVSKRDAVRLACLLGAEASGCAFTKDFNLIVNEEGDRDSLRAFGADCSSRDSGYFRAPGSAGHVILDMNGSRPRSA